MSDFSKTTKKDFELFKSECKRWIDVFNLRSWRNEIGIAKLEGRHGQCEIHYEARLLQVIISDTLPIENRERFIIETAFHEVFEGGVLGRIRFLAEDREFSQIEFDSEIHAIVNRCQHIMLPLKTRGKGK